MTSCMVSFWRDGRLGSTGSDLTGVAGDVDECALLARLDSDEVRDLWPERFLSLIDSAC
jgi:hypothetical protein